MPTLSLPSVADYTSRGVVSRLVSRGLLRVHGIPVAVLVIKRVIDVAFVLVVFTLGACLFPLVALAITIYSPGPLFYRQKRAAALRRRAPPGRYPFSIV